MHRSYYDKTERQIRDMSCGDARIYLEVEVQRVQCKQKYTLLSNRENLTLDGKKALKKLLKANKRLNAAYLLKESFGQLWSYQTEGWARRFFDNWKNALKWQRLESYEKFAKMIEHHWVLAPASNGPTRRRNMDPFSRFFNDSIITE